jgi:hypothetical protein
VTTVSVWVLVGLSALASGALAVAYVFFEWWRTACRERDTFVELNRIASRDLSAFLKGDSVPVVAICRNCNAWSGHYIRKAEAPVVSSDPEK